MKHTYLVSFESDDISLDARLGLKMDLAEGVQTSLGDVAVAVDRLEPTETHVAALLPREG
jgi:hypothetical protein